MEIIIVQDYSEIGYRKVWAETAKLPYSFTSNFESIGYTLFTPEQFQQKYQREPPKEGEELVLLEKRGR